MPLTYEKLTEGGLEPVVICGDNGDGTYSSISSSSPLSVVAGKGELTLDAWGRQKSITDKSLLHGMFTNSIIPAAVFKETINGVEQATFVNATSSDGLLVMQAGSAPNDETVLDSFRSPRYEPNRGHLYSVSILLPDPTANGERDFGMFTEENGAFFRLKAGANLYACRRTTTTSGGTVTVEELIAPSAIPAGVDLSKGNIYDIQMQWRGVGNICFYMGDPATGASVCVHRMLLLNTLDNLSISNPALPVAYRCQNLGNNVFIRSGCVDISTEGGTDNSHTYGSIPVPVQSGDLAISGFDVPALVVRNKRTVGGLRNVRDLQALGLYAYADARAFVKVWHTRDDTAITLNDQSWTDYGDGSLEFIHYDNPNVTTPITFDTAKAVQTFGSRVVANTTFFTPAIFEGKTEIHQSAGDLLIFTLHRDNGGVVNGGVTFEFGQEI